MSINFHKLNRSKLVDPKDLGWNLFRVAIVRESKRNWWLEVVVWNREVNVNLFWFDKKFKAQLKAENM